MRSRLYSYLLLIIIFLPILLFYYYYNSSNGYTFLFQTLTHLNFGQQGPRGSIRCDYLVTHCSIVDYIFLGLSILKIYDFIISGLSIVKIHDFRLLKITWDGPTDGPTDGRTDLRTDGRTDGPTDGHTLL